MYVSEQERAAAKYVAKLLDSVDAGKKETTLQVAREVPLDNAPVVVLTLAQLLVDAEMQVEGLQGTVERLQAANIRLQQQATQLSEAYLDRRRKVEELRRIIDRRAAEAPPKRKKAA